MSLEQAINGTEVNFSHRRMKRCQNVMDQALVPPDACKDCNGTGVQTRVAQSG